jgi:hypothetical protein
MLVKIRKIDIKQGIPSSHNRCPIALRIRKMIPSLYYVSVGFKNRLSSSAEIWINNRVYKLPKISAKFIVEYDKGKPVEPFEFELDIINEICLRWSC